MNRFNRCDNGPGTTLPGYGNDVATQRADFLDGSAVRQIRSLVEGRQGAPVRALDAACAAGGQVRRMARAGARVTAVDLHDHGPVLLQAAASEGLDGIEFLRADLRHVDLQRRFGEFDVIIAQRFIHYLPFADAVTVVTRFRSALADNGKLYLSASGVQSELGRHYQGASALAERYAALWQPMADKHRIHGQVCLYEEADIIALLQAGGMEAERIYTSPFGNIKTIARAAVPHRDFGG